MTTRSKGTIGSVAAVIVVLGTYLYSYGYFDDHHSHFFFTNGEDILLVPDTTANRALAIFYAPISFVVHTPIRFEPKVAPSPRPNKALQRTEAGGQPSPAWQP